MVPGGKRTKGEKQVVAVCRAVSCWTCCCWEFHWELCWWCLSKKAVEPGRRKVGSGEAKKGDSCGCRNWETPGSEGGCDW